MGVIRRVSSPGCIQPRLAAYDFDVAVLALNVHVDVCHAPSVSHVHVEITHG
jgi:hypothetical protein